MTTKLLSLAIALGCLTGAKAKPPALTGWVAYTQSNFRYSGTSAAGQNGNAATFTIGSAWTAFLTRDNSGPLTGRTLGLSAQFTPATGTPTLHFWGEGGAWDRHTWGPNIQLHFSTRTGAYNLSASSGSGQSDYWFCSGHRIPVSAACSVVETVSMDPTLWTNGNGQRGDRIPAAFQYALANAKTVGFSMAGSNWGDIGINATGGTVRVNVASFTIQ